MKLTNEEQLTLLKVKSLLNGFRYFIKDDHMEVFNEFHSLCRKYTSLDTKLKVTFPNVYPKCYGSKL